QVALGVPVATPRYECLSQDRPAAVVERVDGLHEHGKGSRADDRLEIVDGSHLAHYSSCCSFITRLTGRVSGLRTRCRTLPWCPPSAPTRLRSGASGLRRAG